MQELPNERVLDNTDTFFPSRYPTAVSTGTLVAAGEPQTDVPVRVLPVSSHAHEPADKSEWSVNLT